MDTIATWSATEREDLFRDTAELLPAFQSPSLIEKDFWVCWLLRRLFLLDRDVPMIFKGGTSLSKAYRVIRRFSEDIDLSLDRASLGFDEKRWDGGVSRKESKRLLDELSETCRVYVSEPLLDSLRADIRGVLGGSTDEANWSLEVREKGTSDLLFTYPRTAVTLDASGYTAPRVLLEFGARGDHWPEADREIRPYAAEAVPAEFDVGSFSVRTLDVARTFWEKATILHSLANGGVEKIRGRMARHYYDLAQLADAEESAGAVDRHDLLEAVATHKSRFFASAWASYETARPGTLRLVPAPEVLRVLEKDYRAMDALFMDEPPSFETVIERLAAIEEQVNRT